MDLNIIILVVMGILGVVFQLLDRLLDRIVERKSERKKERDQLKKTEKGEKL